VGGKEGASHTTPPPGLFLTHITLYDILSRGWAVIYYRQEVL
jgi:hypothetical protein